MPTVDYSKKVKAAKKYLGDKWCLHPKNRVKRKPTRPPLWRQVAAHLDSVESVMQ